MPPLTRPGTLILSQPHAPQNGARDGDKQEWCGGWDSNPRRTSPSGPEPDPFGHSGTPATKPNETPQPHA